MLEYWNTGKMGSGSWGNGIMIKNDMVVNSKWITSFKTNIPSFQHSSIPSTNLYIDVIEITYLQPIVEIPVH